MMRILLYYLLGIFGVVILVSAMFFMVTNTHVMFLIRLIMASILFLDAICYFVAAWGIAKNIRWIENLTVFLLAINALGVIFDDIGFYDILTLVSNIILLFMLIFHLRSRHK